MSSSSHFRFFTHRFLADTAGLTKRQRADFAMLKVHLHARGAAAMPVEDAKRALGLKAGGWSAFLAALVDGGCIELDRGGRWLRHPEVGRELAARRALSAARSAAGKASAAARTRRKAGAGGGA
ncbi:MAG: hypothetical protein RIC52_00975 [Amphiplicatus sp.]